MANTSLDYNTEYNIKPTVHGNGLLDPDTTYEFVDVLPTDPRQDTFYKVNGSESLYWYNGSMWVDLTQTIIKSGIVYVAALPTTDIDNELIYSVTGSGVLHYYSGDPGGIYDASKWVDISTNHVVEVTALPTTAPKNEIYACDDILYWYNGTEWVDISTEYRILSVIYRADITTPDPYYLYWETSSSILWWYDGTTWHDCSTNFGIVVVDALPTGTKRQDCFYKERTGDNANYIFWWNSTEWVNITRHPGVIITNTDPQTLTNPDIDILYNYTGDEGLWWYNNKVTPPNWVNLAANDAVKLVNGLPTTDLRQNYLYYDVSHTPPTLYWWSGLKWIELSTTYGIIEVTSLADVASPRRDCFYVEPDSEADSLYWYDGSHWHTVAKHNGIEIVNALPSTGLANEDNLYFISTDSPNYDGKLWWHEPTTNIWHDLTLNNGIVEVGALPITNIRTDCIYRCLADDHIYYYYKGEWMLLDYNYGINVVTALPTTNIPTDKLYKLSTGQQLYWWTGNRWKDVSANGGMSSVTSLPATPVDVEVLYRLTVDELDPVTGSIIHPAGIYAWWDNQWWEVRFANVNRGLDMDGNRAVGHSNSTTPVPNTSRELYAYSSDAYGHITDSHRITTSGGLTISNDTLQHNMSTTAVTDNDWDIYNYQYNQYGHVTGRTKVVDLDVSAVQNVTTDTWTFTKKDGTTITKTVFVGG